MEHVFDIVLFLYLHSPFLKFCVCICFYCVYLHHVPMFSYVVCSAVHFS